MTDIRCLIHLVHMLVKLGSKRQCFRNAAELHFVVSLDPSCLIALSQCGESSRAHYADLWVKSQLQRHPLDESGFEAEQAKGEAWYDRLVGGTGAGVRDQVAAMYPANDDRCIGSKLTSEAAVRRHESRVVYSCALFCHDPPTVQTGVPRAPVILSCMHVFVLLLKSQQLLIVAH